MGLLYTDHLTAVIAEEPTSLTELIQSEKQAPAEDPNGYETGDYSAIP